MGNASINAAINAGFLHTCLLEDEAYALQAPVTPTHVWIAVAIIVGLAIAAMAIDWIINS